MIDYFVTSYRDDKHAHIYYFPGHDDSGHPLTRMAFITQPGDYRYTRHQDGSIDYIILEGPKEVTVRIQNVSTRKTEDITLSL